MRSAPFDPTFFERDPLFWPIADAASAFASFATWPPISQYSARASHRAGVTFRDQPDKPRGRCRPGAGPKK